MLAICEFTIRHRVGCNHFLLFSFSNRHRKVIATIVYWHCHSCYIDTKKFSLIKTSSHLPQRKADHDPYTQLIVLSQFFGKTLIRTIPLETPLCQIFIVLPPCTYAQGKLHNILRSSSSVCRTFCWVSIIYNLEYRPLQSTCSQECMLYRNVWTL